jgi:hypothetical protein
MPVLVTGIHGLNASAERGVDGRVKPGHDDEAVCGKSLLL